MKTQMYPCMPPPSPQGDHTGMSGGFPLATQGASGQGTTSSPFTEGLCPTPGGKETPGGELGTQPTTYAVEGAPGEGASASNIGLLQSHQSDQTFRGTGQK